MFYFFFFFFSSRRRHTRLTCDWSSDVCSSDLPAYNRGTHQRSRPRATHSARRAQGARGCAAIRTRAPPPRSRPPPRATDRTVSFVPSPPPRLVVLVFVETGGRVARPALRLVHDPPTLRDLRRIVRHAHLIMKQLAPRVSEEILE